MNRLPALIASVALFVGSCRSRVYAHVDEYSVNTTTLVYTVQVSRPEEATLFAYDADGHADTIEEALVIYGAQFDRQPLGTELEMRPLQDWQYLVAPGCQPTRYVTSHARTMRAQERAALNGAALIPRR